MTNPIAWIVGLLVIADALAFCVLLVIANVGKSAAGGEEDIVDLVLKTKDESELYFKRLVESAVLQEGAYLKVIAKIDDVNSGHQEELRGMLKSLSESAALQNEALSYLVGYVQHFDTRPKANS